MLHEQLGVPKLSGSIVSSLFRSSRKKPDEQVAPPDAAVNGQAGPKKLPRKNRILLAVSSLAIAIVLWLYVQVTINPIESKTFMIPLNYTGITEVQEKGFELQYPLQNVQVTLMGRKKAISVLSNNDVKAYLDFAQIESTGLVRLEVQIDTGSLLYFRVTYKSPSAVTVSVREKREAGYADLYKELYD